MNLDDETLLSAYLDDELEPADRLRVEAALGADVRLAAQLRELVMVRDWVGALPRPEPAVDLAREVTRRIGVMRRRGSFSPRVRSLALAASILAVAATIGLTLALQPPRPPVHVAADPGADILPRVAPPIAPVEESAASRPAPTELPAPLAVAAVKPAEREARTGADVQAEREFRALLDNPRLVKIFLVTDVLGGPAISKVEDLVRKTPRVDPRYARVTVRQGIVIDPQHPNEATVFTLVLNDPELDTFRTEMHQRFPESVAETKPDPTVVTHLAEIGQVTVATGPAVAQVDSAEDSARLVAALRTPSEPRSNEPDDETEPSGPPRATAPPATVRRGSSVVLVWVTSR